MINSFSFFIVVEHTHIQILGLLYLFFAFAGLGTMVTIFPTICVKAFGSDVGSKIYPIIYLCFSTASLTAYLIYSYVASIESMFYIFGCMTIIGLATNVFFNPSPSWHAAILESEEKKSQEMNTSTTA